MPCLLAVDLGLRTGLALYGDDGRLIWYRSHNYGSTDRLRRGVFGLMESIPDLAAIIIEGGGNLAAVWEKEAGRRGILVHRAGAEAWRQILLLPREQRTGAEAKKRAGDMARRVIDWSGAPRPSSLRHDAAEAILIGLWGLLHFGWITDFPAELQRR